MRLKRIKKVNLTKYTPNIVHNGYGKRRARMVLIFPPEIDKLNEEIKPYENCENVPPEIENKRKIVSAWIEEQFRLEEEIMLQS